MKADLVRIGNSRGIRIPKPLIEQCGFGDTVELHVKDGCLIICQARLPRQDWAEAFRAAGPPAEDKLLLDLPPTAFDNQEWEW